MADPDELDEQISDKLTVEAGDLEIVLGGYEFPKR
jgi:hypothetical protein